MNITQKGNLAGVLAIILWATLALFTVLTYKIPPFQLTAMAFGVAFVIGLGLWIKAKKGILIHLRLPWRVWLLGIYGLFGYHFFYFMAIKNAPPLEANLINYLWPLFIVLFSSFLPTEKLRWFHVLGSILGLFGAVLLIGFGQEVQFSPEYGKGYIYAFICALIWSSYSVLSRHFGTVSTYAVGGFCGATALLSLIAHFIFEETYIPSSVELLATIVLGLGPVGLAFFVWDYGMKKGDIKLLGSLSYATPLLSTFLLIISGQSSPNTMIWVACLLIVLGSIVSSFPLFRALYEKIKIHNQRFL